MSHSSLRREPRWPALLALLAIGGLYFALPDYLTVGPEWLLLAVVALLSVPAVVFHYRGQHALNQALGYVTLVVVTSALTGSLTLLIVNLPAHRDSPQRLLLAGVGLWISNILTFASWYWRLDAGGPHQRESRGGHVSGAFLFPQMALPAELRIAVGAGHWRPGFVDYLFLAFSASTAFSPTDVPVLSRWAKLMMMLQACISLATVAILVGRAVNVI